jgi:hypothetical protein
MIRQLSLRGTKLLLFLFFVTMICFTPAFVANAAELTPVASDPTPVAIEQTVVHREVPEYICVASDEPSSAQYRYFIDEDGFVCVKDSNGKTFAKQCSSEDIDAIYVYTTSENELIPMIKNGKQIVVRLV